MVRELNTTGDTGDGWRHTRLASCVQSQHKETHLLVAKDLPWSQVQHDCSEKREWGAVPNAFERFAPMVGDVDGGGGRVWT